MPIPFAPIPPVNEDSVFTIPEPKFVPPNLYLLEEVERLRAERDTAAKVQRSLFDAIGILRETVGSLWTFVDATKHEAAEEGYMREDACDSALAWCKHRMGEVDRLLGISK